MKRNTHNTQGETSPQWWDGMLLLLCLVAGLLAISGGSFWIDEGNAATKAVQPTLTLFWKTLIAEGGSDAQMPLYMFYLWEWEKLVGHGEWALRMANLPLWLLACGVLLATARKLPAFQATVTRMAVFLAAVSPFLWQYLDEARPYTMQFAGGALLLAFLLELTADPLRIRKTATVWKGAAAVVLLAGGSLLGVSWAACGGLVTVWLLWVDRERLRQQPGRIEKGAIAWALIALVALAVLGIYHLKILAMGGGASRQGNSVAGLGFIGYELAGFLGLGPGRLVLREGAIGPALRGALPLLLLGVLGIGLPLLAAVSRIVLNKESIGAKVRTAFPVWLLLFVLPVAFTLVAGLLTEVRLLGRHFMPGFAFLLWGLALLLVALRQPGQGRLERLRSLWLLLPLTWLLSAALFRWSDQPQRDDYRAAAASAHRALQQGQRVIWAADASTAGYYGLPRQSTDQFHLVANATENLLADGADLLVLSRRDIYDNHRALTDGVERHGYREAARFAGFTLYERP